MRERLGSGGPRGLQILRSGVKSVRGGFDSHAFPPLALAVALILLAPRPGAATGSAPLADSSGRGGPRAGEVPREGRFDAPGWVMMRSMTVPGWGQLHNGSWIKAGIIAGLEGALIVGIVHDNQDMSHYQHAADVALDAYNAAVADSNGVAADAAYDAHQAAISAYNDALNSSVTRAWLLGGTIVYAMVDAYVDAHFRHFAVEFKHDPALPGGTAPKSETRLSLGWRF
jgi:hypothetical protein